MSVFVKSANFSHLHFCNFVVVMLLSLVSSIRSFGTPPGVPICCILGSGSNRKVIGIEAGRVIARMHDYLIVRNLAVDDLERQTVNSPVFAGVANDSVTLWPSFMRPLKTCFRVGMILNHLENFLSLPRLSLVGIETFVFRLDPHWLYYIAGWTYMSLY